MRALLTFWISMAALSASAGLGNQDPNAYTANPYWLNGFASPTIYPSAVTTAMDWILTAATSTLIGNALNLNTAYALNNGGFDSRSNAVAVSGYNIGAANQSQ
jgi:hypothetical protein